jgi:hypothetical protein
MFKTLIIYVFHEYNANVEYYLNNALFNDVNKTFIIVQNHSQNNIIPQNLLEKLLSYDNSFLYIRDNVGHDFQAYNNVLFLPQNILNKKIIYENGIINNQQYLYLLYDKFVILNSTVIGPYHNKNSNWVDYFTAPLSKDIKITCLSVNFLSKKYISQYIAVMRNLYNISINDLSHVQTMCFSLDKECLEILIFKKLFHIDKKFPMDKQMLIVLAEIAMTVILRDQKKAIYSFLPEQGYIPHNRIDNIDNPWCVKRYTEDEMLFLKKSWW